MHTKAKNFFLEIPLHHCAWPTIILSFEDDLFLVGHDALKTTRVRVVTLLSRQRGKEDNSDEQESDQQREQYGQKWNILPCSPHSLLKRSVLSHLQHLKRNGHRKRVPCPTVSNVRVVGGADVSGVIKLVLEFRPTDNKKLSTRLVNCSHSTSSFAPNSALQSATTLLWRKSA